jgi:hypothetical protein
MGLLASSYDQSRFFKATDLAAEKKLRIKSVTEELIGIGVDKELKLVVWFTNDEHGLVLNRVNNRTIRGAFGDAVDGWAGKIIVLFPTTAEFRGKMGPALRIRIPPPKGASGNGQPVATKAKPSSVTEQLDDFSEPPETPVAKPARGSTAAKAQQPESTAAGDMDDEIPW